MIGDPFGLTPVPTDPAVVCAIYMAVARALTLTSTPAAAPPLPLRPGFGTVGERVQVFANHFRVEVEEGHLYHYDVSITPACSSKKINRAVIDELVCMYRLGHVFPAYDGMKSLYTALPYPFSSKEFVVKLWGSPFQWKERKFKVCIKLVNKYYKQHETPQKIIQALDVALKTQASNTCTVVGGDHIQIGRSLFFNFGTGGDIGGGFEFWRGYYQSLRPTQFGLSLNIDVSAKAFYQSTLVTEFVQQHFNYRDISKGLSNRDCLELKKNLKGVKVYLTYAPYQTYRISGVTAQPLSELTFFLEEDKQTKVSMIRYYHDKYGISLKHVALPALQCGNDSRPVYLPMELSVIIRGQRYTGKLDKKQVTKLLRATCSRPTARGKEIKMVADDIHYHQNLMNSQFGIKVSKDMELVDARVLPPPMLKYHDSGLETKDTPRMGAWNMDNKKMVNGGTVDFWAFINFSGIPEESSDRFIKALVAMCNSKGMMFNSKPLFPLPPCHRGHIETVLRYIHKRSVHTLEKIGHGKRHLQLLIIVLPDEGVSYGLIKRICETELGIVSQCCNPKHVSKCSKQYLENLSLKINVKVGGRNTVLNDAIQRSIPLVSDDPTIIIGADVAHPQPGEDSSPSIAAVVASMDWPEVYKYRGVLSQQNHREEIIQDLYKSKTRDSGIIRELFIAFRTSTGQKPRRIIFYRDGVSEGQFSQVLLYEMDAIRKACASLEEGYMPPVTFVVVQKRHHTRLFLAGNKSHRKCNVLPGTVVDTKICHPTEFDFYLTSHAAIQGTSCPTHYHVLFDENKFSADALQILTNNLCYTYARCTRAVSVVPPVYYAHLAASRGRYYIKGDASDDASSGGTAAQFQVLPDVHHHVKDVMFFC